ncbi:glycosyltransferase involved in cell wall biosynthesis [Novosphingobium sp. SG751A]|uniref:glycosyltransferase n=1 Tax=Novosphingobium sp. SG751A TaxID=2587000 RepID=UPI001556739A|nr:glycosyltransferase [Novosphingobium sp. SG751A]NOW45588.1 glycosyltransferase involved in cell wall biosynthesis [Novosphingobium sp. SG751A]
MRKDRLKRLALVWSQFAAYHVDRCEAVGMATAGRAQVLAVEVATSSKLYAWEASGGIAHAEKLTLFDGCQYEDVSPWRRFRKLFATLAGCDVAYIGIGYHEPEIVPLVWLLRLFGVRVILMLDSKFDDSPRKSWFEFLKSLGLAAYSGAIVAGKRHFDYIRFLGFKRRMVLPGYDCVGVDRIRKCLTPEDVSRSWDDRDFLFVGRFVEKKNLTTLIDAYALYHAQAGDKARRLVLMGDGPLRDEIERKIANMGLGHKIIIIGFMPSQTVVKAMAGALALLLVSHEEQWGLVINEAVAVGLPVIASSTCGATDLLVRNLVNGYVVDCASVEGIASAMTRMTRSQGEWQTMSEESTKLAHLGDASFFAQSVMQIATVT